MEQNGLKGIQQGLWAIAASLLILTLSLTLAKKPRYLLGQQTVLDTYTGQQFQLKHTRYKAQEPAYKFEALTKKITD